MPAGRPAELSVLLDPADQAVVAAADTSAAKLRRREPVVHKGFQLGQAESGAAGLIQGDQWSRRATV